MLEKGAKLGKKLAISGGGRCNVTNRLPVEEIVKHIPGNGRFLYSPFTVYNNEDIITFFEGLGVALKEEDHGRMFPVSNRAQDVVDALIRQLQHLHVEVRLHTAVSKLVMDEEKFLVYVLLMAQKFVAKQSLWLLVVRLSHKQVQQETAIHGQNGLAIQLQHYFQLKSPLFQRGFYTSA